MIDVALFDELKKYLTKEFMSLSRQKDEKLGEKVMLEVEKQQEEQQLFENKDTVRIRRLFSPLDDEIFEKEDFSSYRNNKILQKIQIIENELDKMDQSMGEIKKYLCFIQMLENERFRSDNMSVNGEGENIDTVWIPDKEEVRVEPKERKEEQEESKREKKDITSNLKETLNDTVEFLKERYPNTEILLDFDNHGVLTGKGLNRYFIRVLTYTISASIEASGVDTVILEGEITKEKVVISLQMLLDNNLVDEYSYQYVIYLKEENKSERKDK